MPRKFTMIFYGTEETRGAPEGCQRGPGEAQALGAPPAARPRACGPHGTPPNMIPKPNIPINIETPET
jgi:hypothetical protein